MTTFAHALDKHSYPKEGFLRRSKTNLECYDDGKLINHGSIKLRLQHYLDKSFQDHYFYIVETKTCKEILVGHAASTRLGPIQVLCKNILSIVENETNTNSFQDPCLEVDGKTSLRNQRVASKSFQDHPSSSFKTMAMYTCTETPFKTPAKDTQGRKEQNRHKSTPSKTLGVDGIRAIRETRDANTAKDMVKIGGRETLFKTMGKSGRKKVPPRTWNMRSVRHLLSRPLTKVELIEFLSRP